MTARRGFTLIEMVVSIALIGVIIVPATMTVLEYVRLLEHNSGLAAASNLAGRELAAVNNMSFGSIESVETADYLGSGYDMERSVGLVDGTNGKVKRVEVSIYHGSAAHTPATRVAKADAYVSEWTVMGLGSSGGAPDDPEASHLEVVVDEYEKPVGSINWYDIGMPVTVLQDFQIKNTGATGNITVTGIKLYTTANVGLQFGVATIGGRDVYRYEKAGYAFTPIPAPPDPPATVVFQRNFFINSMTECTGFNAFYFSDPGVGYELNVVFIFSDGTESGPYSWTYTP